MTMSIGRTPAYFALLSICLIQVQPIMAQHPTGSAASRAPEWARGKGARLEGKTNVERAMGKCVGSILGGALLGALAGAAAGNTKKGALIGTAVGVGVCAIVMKVASKRDKIALREAQLNAANAGRIERRSWVTAEGAHVDAVVTPSAPVPLVVSSTTGSYRCRTDNRCLVGDEWVPYQTLVPQQTTTPQNISAQPQVYQCRRLETSIIADGDNAHPGSDAVCLVGDAWVTGDKLKKLKIRGTDIVTI